MRLGFLFVFVFLLYGTCSSRVGFKKAKLYYLCFIDFPGCSLLFLKQLPEMCNAIMKSGLVKEVKGQGSLTVSLL